MDKPDADAPLDEEEQGDDQEPFFVSCPRCAHANLEFRSHCRRCGATLLGSSGVMPFLELIEWSPTDGPEQRNRARPRVSFVIVLALAVLAPLVLAAMLLTALTTSPASAAIAFLPVLILIVIIALALRRSRTRSESRQEEDEAPELDEAERPCPECGGPVYFWDDICTTCGAVVAEDL